MKIGGVKKTEQAQGPTDPANTPANKPTSGLKGPGGAPKGNRNAEKAGLHARDAGRVDLRRREDRAVMQTLRGIELDLGDDLSTQERVILDGVGRKLRDVFKVESYLAGLASIVNKRKRSLLPIVTEKHRLLESIARDLERLGLAKVKREPLTLAAYLEAKKTEPLSQAKEDPQPKE